MKGQEKSSRHVAMVAKFLDENKPKIHLKSKFALFQTCRSYSISFHLSNVGEIFRMESERTVSEFRKRKSNCLCCVHLLHSGRVKLAEKRAKKRDVRAKLLFY